MLGPGEGHRGGVTAIRVLKEGLSLEMTAETQKRRRQPSKQLGKEGPRFVKDGLAVSESQGAPVGRVWDVNGGRAVTLTSPARVCKNTRALLASLMNTASHSNHLMADSLNSERGMRGEQQQQKKVKYPLRVTRLSSVQKRKLDSEKLGGLHRVT